MQNLVGALDRRRHPLLAVFEAMQNAEAGLHRVEAARQGEFADSRAIPRTDGVPFQMMCKSGLSHLITMDLHQKEIQGFFDCPVDNLRASPFLLQYIQESVGRIGRNDCIPVD